MTVMMMMMILSVMLSNLISKLHTKAHPGYQFRLSNRTKKNIKDTSNATITFSPNPGGSRSQKKKI